MPNASKDCREWRRMGLLSIGAERRRIGVGKRIQLGRFMIDRHRRRRKSNPRLGLRRLAAGTAWSSRRFESAIERAPLKTTHNAIGALGMSGAITFKLAS